MTTGQAMFTAVGCDTGRIVGALLSEATSKPHTTVARGGERQKFSKGCMFGSGGGDDDTQ